MERMKKRDDHQDCRVWFAGRRMKFARGLRLSGRCRRHCARICQTVVAWPNTPDKSGKQMDSRFGLCVDVFLMFHDQIFLSQVEFCVFRICGDVVAGIVESKEHPHAGFARISCGDQGLLFRGHVVISSQLQ